MFERKRLRLGDLIGIRHGYAFKGEYFSDSGGGPLLVTPGNFMLGGGFKSGKPKYYLGPVPPEFLLSPGDLVVTMTDLSKSGDTLGYPAIIPSGQPYLHNQRIGLITVNAPDRLDIKYLNYALRTDSYRNHVLASATGSTVRHTSPSRICDYELVVPALPEQRAVAAVLGSLDDKIEVNSRIERTSFNLAECTYRELSLSAVTSVRLGTLFDFKYGKALPASHRVVGAVPVFGSSGVVGRHKEALVAGPGIIVGRKGTVGAVHWSEEDFFPIDTTFYVQLFKVEIPMEFAFFILRHVGLEKMNSDSAVPGLNRSNALALQVSLPEDCELQNFQKEVRPAFELRSALSAESLSLGRLRDTLLPGLMSGEIRVRDAQRIVEGAT